MPFPEPPFCGLLPHPPIIVPEVGRDRLEDCRATFEACRELARRLVETRPDRLFMVSPHSPRQGQAFGLWSGDRLNGDLSRFGAPGSGIDLANDTQVIEALRAAAARKDLATWSIPSQPLDHGAVVPLWFLADAGWSGPTLITSLPWHCSPSLMESFGGAVAEALSNVEGRSALLASGDMSHRLLPDAPAGYHPRAVEFDRALTDLVTQGRLDPIRTIDPELRELAAEDAADVSMLVAAAIDCKPHGAEVISYEHPFGVGYLVAVFHDGSHDDGSKGRPPAAKAGSSQIA